MEIILRDLPKISLNEWYAGNHWTKRKQIKDTYLWLIKSQFKGLFKKVDKYIVSYEFCFKTRPIDATNTIAMVKMIEDIIFEDDKWDIITQITISSQKCKEEFVKITIDKC